MEVKVIKSGYLKTNSYILNKGQDCIIIDPAFAYEEISKYIDKNNFNVLGILLTHGHFDHIEASDDLASKYRCKVYISKADLNLALDAKLNGAIKFIKKEITVSKQYLVVFDHEVILKLADFMIDILFPQGHSQGSCCFLIDNELFSGDTLFKDGIGRVDLYGGDKNQMDQSLKYLFSLNDEVVVFPGHGDETTILKERSRYI